MKSIKKIGILLSSLTMIVSLTACDGKKDYWNYTKEDIGGAKEVTATLSPLENKNLISVETGDTLFTSALEEKAVLFFQFSKAKEKAIKDGKDYIDYDSVKDYLLTYSNFNNLEGLNGLNFNCSNEIGYDFALMIHKDYVVDGDYMIVEAKEIVEPKDDTPQEEKDQKKFENDYITRDFTWKDDTKFYAEILDNIGDNLSSPAAAAGGISIGTVITIFNMIISHGNLFFGDGPMNPTIAAQLNTINTKLDYLADQISKNTQKLVSEIARTQAMINQVLLNQANETISGFNTNYLNPINTFNNSVSAMLQTSYKALVKTDEPVSIDVYLYKNDKNQWALRPYVDNNTQETDTHIEVKIVEFPYAKLFLEKSSDIIEKGFMDQLNKDIDLAVNTTKLPEGMTKEAMRYFVSSNINEMLTQEYFSKPEKQNEAQNFASLIENTCTMYGGGEVTSVLNAYFNRIRQMYNFGSELKDPMRALLANHLYNLDINVAKASLYLRYAGFNAGSLPAKYKVARKTIKDLYDSILKVDDNLCNISGDVLKGNMFDIYYEQHWKNPESHNFPEWTGRLYIRRITGGRNWKYEVIDENKGLKTLDFTVQSGIIYRMSLLKESGYLKDSNMTYLQYLNKAGVIASSVLETRDALVAANLCKADDIKIATTFDEKVLSESDANKEQYKCTERANGNSYYFDHGQWVTFKQGRSKKYDTPSQYWSGRKMVSVCIDPNTGNAEEKFLCGRCQYNETHKKWSNDEDWLFTTKSGYFLALEIVNTKK